MKTSKRAHAASRMRITPRISVVSRLNMSLWIRLIGIFLLLDFVLFAVVAVATMIHAERTAADVAARIQDPTSVTEDLAEILSVSGVRVIQLDRKPEGWYPPGLTRSVFPEHTKRAARRYEFAEETGRTSWWHIEGLVFRIEDTYDDSSYAVMVELEPVLRFAKVLILALLIIQIYAAIRSLRSSGRIIHRTLSPIIELAERAQSIDRDRGPFTLEEVQALTGELDRINAAKLDTRIEVDGAKDELKGVASAINSMLDRVNESYKAQARFVSDASHELRTPIAAIQGYVNLLDRWGKHDEQALQESIDAIKDEAANMKDLVEQLLFLARADNHVADLTMETFDVAGLASAVLQETQMIDQSHGLVSRLSSVYVHADAKLIKQALRILVDNAIKYTPAGGTIVISVTRRGRKAWMTVQDDGVGIQPEAVPRIFDRFYRADVSRARETGGTGLGLAIAKWIADSHGGHVEVLSREGIGTRISIVLPATEQQDAAFEKTQ